MPIERAEEISKMPLGGKEIVFFLKTTKNWYSNFEGDYVKVLVKRLSPVGDETRIGIWGTDNFGIVKDFLSIDSAIIEALLLATLKDIDAEFLIRNHGFKVF